MKKIIKASVAVCNALSIDNREIIQLTVVRQDRIKNLVPRITTPFICMLNGEPLLRRYWRRRLQDGDILLFIKLPLDGGGGGSNPLRVVATLALLAAAPYLAGLTLGAGAAAWQTAALTGAYFMAGTMLINAVLPVQQPEQHNLGNIQASPTYSLTGQGNQARLNQMIPVQYGRLRVFPDLAAQPYTEFIGNDQYLNQLHCIGNGSFSVEAVQIEDTEITNFQDVEYEVLAPGVPPTLFPSAVTASNEVSGQDAGVQVAGTYSQTGTTITVTYTLHGLTAGTWVLGDFSGGATDGLYEVQSATDNTFTLTAGASGTYSGAVSYSTFIGPFAANAPDTDTFKIAIDVVCPQGLIHAEDDGRINQFPLPFSTYRREIDDAGDPVGAWVLLGSETITAATATPLRRTYEYDVAAARYEVMFAKTQIDYGRNVRAAISWVGLRCYFQELTDFGDVTLLAVRMKATNNLSMMVSRKVNVICTRKVPIWNSGTQTWSAPTASTSIAWAAADILRNSTYGSGAADTELDIAGLNTLATTWATRTDECNIRFDSDTTVGDALAQILACGRAKWIPHAGTVLFHRDQTQTIPVAMFTARTCRDFKSSFAIPTEQMPDAVRVTYFDRVSWIQRTVTCSLPGSTEDEPSDLTLIGVTDREHAYREGLYHAAANKYRREEISFTTDMTGFIPLPGDLISVSNDMPSWGTSGEVTAYDTGTKIATLDEPVAFGVGTYYIAFRKDDGSQAGPFVCTAGVDAFHVVLASDPVITIRTKGNRNRTAFAFGVGETYRALAIVTGVRPRGFMEAEISAVLEDPNVHLADSGASAPVPVYSSLSNLTTKPVLSGVYVMPTPGNVNAAQISWQPAVSADRYLVEMSIDNLTWTRIADTSATNIIANAPYGLVTFFRVAPVGLSLGDWVTAVYYGASAYMYGVYSDSFYVGSGSDPFYNEAQI